MKSIIVTPLLLVLTGIIVKGQDTISYTMGGCVYHDFKSTKEFIEKVNNLARSWW